MRYKLQDQATLTKLWWKQVHISFLHYSFDALLDSALFSRALDRYYKCNTLFMHLNGGSTDRSLCTDKNVCLSKHDIVINR